MAQSSGVPAATPDAAAGQAVFNDNCVACHGVLALGDGEAVSQLGGNIPTALAGLNYLRTAVPSEMFDRVLDQLVRLSCWLTHTVRNGHRPERRLLALDKEIPLADLDALN